MPKIVDHAERRQRIADAVFRVTARDGLDVVSLRHVASEAGVTAGMVQHYFPSKDAMMAFAMQVVGERYEQRISAAVSRLGDSPAPHDLVRALLHSLIPSSDVELDDGRIGLAFQSYAATRPELSTQLAEGDTQLQTYVGELILTIAPSASHVDDRALGLIGAAEGLGMKVLAANIDPQRAHDALDAQIDLALTVGVS